MVNTNVLKLPLSSSGNENLSCDGQYVYIWKTGGDKIEFAKLKTDDDEQEWLSDSDDDDDNEDEESLSGVDALSSSPSFGSSSWLQKRERFLRKYEESSSMTKNPPSPLSNFQSVYLDEKGIEEIKDLCFIGGDFPMVLITTMSGKVARLSPKNKKAVEGRKPIFIKEFESHPPVEKIFESPDSQFAFVTKSSSSSLEDSPPVLWGCTIIKKSRDVVVEFQIESIDKWVNTTKLPRFDSLDDIGFVRLDSMEDPNHPELSWGQIFYKNSGKTFVWGFKAYTQFHTDISAEINRNNHHHHHHDDDDDDLPNRDKPLSFEMIGKMIETEKKLRKKYNRWRDPFLLEFGEQNSQLSACVLGGTNGFGITKEGYLWFFGFNCARTRSLLSLDYRHLNLPKSVECPEGAFVDGGGKMLLNESGNLLLTKEGYVYKWNETISSLPGELYCYIPIHTPMKLRDLITVSRPSKYYLGLDVKGRVHLLRKEPAAMSGTLLKLVRETTIEY